MSKTWPKPPQVGTGCAVGGFRSIWVETGRIDPISEGPEVALNGLWAIDNMGYCQSWCANRDRAAVVWRHNRDGCARQLVQLMQLFDARASVRWIWGGRCAPIFSARSTELVPIHGSVVELVIDRWVSGHEIHQIEPRTSNLEPRTHKFQPRPKGRGRASLTV